MSVLKTIITRTTFALLAFFVVTYTIYQFNLDNKLIAAATPLLEKWHNSQQQKRTPMKH